MWNLIKLREKYDLLIMKIGLFIILITLVFADQLISAKRIIKDYIGWTITEFIGIIVSVFLIEVIISRNNKKQEKIEIKKRIISANELLDLSIERYLSYSKMITNTKEDEHLIIFFPFKKLKSSLYMPSFYIIDSFGKKAINYYFEALDKVINILEEVVFSIDFKGHKEFGDLEKHIIKFLQEIPLLNPKEAILNNLQYFNWGSTIHEHWKFIEKCFEEIGDLPEDSRKNSNIMTPYWLLYQQINHTLQRIKLYREIAQKFNVK